MDEYSGGVRNIDKLERLLKSTHWGILNKDKNSKAA
jgi:hypothetical protein